MELGLDGKVAIVTGGSKGIGRATALGLLAEGASVIICARGTEALSRKSDLDRTGFGPGTGRSQYRLHRAPAAPTLGACPADPGDILRRRRPGCDDVGHGLAGDSVTQAHEHRAVRSLGLDTHDVEHLADEEWRVSADPCPGHPLGGGVGVLDPLPRALLIGELLQNEHLMVIVESLENPSLSDAGRG